MNDPKKIYNVHKGHRQRLRDMLNTNNLTSFSEHQILELMLSFVIPQKDVNPLAHNLLNEFGCLANVLDASVGNLKKINGIGDVASSFLSFCSKLPEIYKKSKVSNNTIISGPTSVINFLKSAIDLNSVENFYYLCLGHAGNILCFKKFTSGTDSKITINNRDFLMQILKFPTVSLIICHTHPNCTADPSNEDILFTNNIIDILSPLSINLCDHIILSPSGEYSFFKNGLLNRKENQTTILNKNCVSNSPFIYK